MKIAGLIAFGSTILILIGCFMWLWLSAIYSYKKYLLDQKRNSKPE